MPRRRPIWTWWHDMAKPRGILTGPEGAVAIEYLRASRVLRFVAPSDRSAGAVEMPLAEFVAGLGLVAADLTSNRQYLLFGGTGGGAGGLRDLVGAFTTEATAKDAFRSLRLSPDFRGGCAELVVLQPEGRMKPVCWFGRAPSGPSSWAPPTPAVRGKRVRSRWAALRAPATRVPHRSARPHRSRLAST